jgi:hypothetical protein
MSTPLPRRLALRTAAAAVAGVATAGAVAACTGSERDTRDANRHRRHTVVPGTADRAGTLDPRAEGGDAAATVAASRALLESASVVVVALDRRADLTGATTAARSLGIPLLVDGPETAAELDRLGTRTVIRWAWGEGATGSSSPASTAIGDREVVDATDVADLPQLPGLPAQPPRDGASVLVQRGVTVPTSIGATIAAVGAAHVSVNGTDPRTSTDIRAAVRTAADAPVLAIGPGFGPAGRFGHRVRTARYALELPGGGLLPFPGRRMVALYGHPRTAALGMLGEQSAQESVVRATALAEQYAPLTEEAVVPAFELIATVASGSAQKDGSYSRRTPVGVLLPWVQAAERAGTYVVLDLQPGRDDFLTQAKTYEELLRRPWVGLALDPEWRLQPGEKPLRQIGHVGIDEVNAVGAWLAGLVREHDLPPKVLTLHQFRPSMVRDRERLDTSLDEVQWLVHADGQGGQNAKQGTWSALRRDLPEGVWLGWKNFEDEDTPMLTPEQTVARVHPTPWFVSYQ